MLGAAEYPLRPAAWRGWGGRHPPCRCYLPPSWPVYRLQRVVSAALCLLAVLLLCLLALVLLQAAPASPRVRGGQSETGGLRLAGPGLGGAEDEYEDYSDSGLDEYEDDEDEEELVMSEDYEDEDEDGHDYEDNPEFDMSYFDFSIKEGAAGGGGGARPPPPRQQQEDEAAAAFSTPALRASLPRLALPPRRLVSREGLEVVRDGVLFSPQVEALLKDKGFSDAEVGRLLWQLRRRDVAELRDPSWERCGRPKNQWLRLAGGAAACARYRYPDDHLLLGEVLSFYLARLLGVGRVPPATLARPDHPRWAAAAPQMERAGWGAAPVVVLTPWLPDLVRDHMPSSLHHAIATNTTLGLPAEEKEEEEAEGEDEETEGRAEEEENWGAESERRRKTGLGRSEGGAGGVNKKEGVVKEGGKVEEGKGGAEGGKIAPPSLQEASEGELVRLLQWSDLLVFDFLTANYDRVAYMMDAAEGEEGRPEVLKGTVHNLVRNRATDGLWLLDNESGLVDGYNLLYGRGDPAQATRFASFHTRLLRAMCVFRRATVEAVMALSAHPRPHELLVEFARENEPLFALLPDPLQEDRFLWRLSERLQEVRAWVLECARRAARTMKKRGRGDGV